MTDEIELLFALLEEEGEERPLEFASVAVPRAFAQGETTDPLTAGGSSFASVEAVGEDSWGTGYLAENLRGEVSAANALANQVAERRRTALMAEHLHSALPVGSGEMTISGQSGRGIATPGQMGWSGGSVPSFDRMVERDARRYDGGFLLG